MSLRVRLLNASLLALIAFAIGVLVRALLRLHDLGWTTYVRPWCTVVACGLIVGGGVAALRNRTWGLLLLLLSSVSFAAALAFGIAPPFYALVTAAGALALALAVPPLLVRDRAATYTVVGLAVGLGVLAAALAGPGLDRVRMWLLGD